MAKEMTYLEINGKYLVMDEQGDTKVLASEKEFNEYLTENNCKVVN